MWPNHVLQRADSKWGVAALSSLGVVRAVKPILSFLVVGLLAGCSPSPRTVSSSHTGDLGRFILKTVEQHGGQAKQTNGLPQMPGQWRTEVLTGAEYLDGREQVTIRVSGDHFQWVTGYLAQAFGQPSEPARLLTNGYTHGVYSGADIGVALQFYRGDNETGLILVGDLRR